MSNKEFAKIFNWGELCNESCYDPYDHSHDFLIGKDFEKTCESCAHNLKPSFQAFGHEFGQNKVILANKYICDHCTSTSELILYEGVSKSYQEIYAEGIDTINNLKPVSLEN